MFIIISVHSLTECLDRPQCVCPNQGAYATMQNLIADTMPDFTIEHYSNFPFHGNAYQWGLNRRPF